VRQRVLGVAPAIEAPTDISRLLWYHHLVELDVISEKEFKRVKRRLLNLPEETPKEHAKAQDATSRGGSGSS